jgi:hypothetical protein
MKAHLLPVVVVLDDEVELGENEPAILVFRHLLARRLFLLGFPALATRFSLSAKSMGSPRKVPLSSYPSVVTIAPFSACRRSFNFILLTRRFNLRASSNCIALFFTPPRRRAVKERETILRVSMREAIDS